MRPFQSMTKTYEKIFAAMDTEKVVFNVFAHPPGIYSLPGRITPNRKPLSTGYLPFIKQVLDREGVEPLNSVFCFYPKNFLGKEIVEYFEPAKVLVDVVDDHRAWPGLSEKEKIRLTSNYQELLAIADMAFVNCEPMQKKMKHYFPGIRLVPNGCDKFPLEKQPGNPAYKELKNWHGKIIGFMGNLETKIDIALIKKIAIAFPECRLVLVGSTHANPAVLDLQALDNVMMPGVAPYEEATAWIRRFDVGIVPHLNNDLTSNMNPLKLFVYLQNRIPVVTTNIPNLGQTGNLVRIANSHEEFLEHITNSLENPEIDIDAPVPKPVH